VTDNDSRVQASQRALQSISIMWLATVLGAVLITAAVVTVVGFTVANRGVEQRFLSEFDARLTAIAGDVSDAARARIRLRSDYRPAPLRKVIDQL